jgi:S-adenosylmethionine hydrolase
MTALRAVVSLLTDFGLLDPFVAEMKAVILSICPEARIVDITHQVEKFDIRMGSFLLASAAPYFPEGSVHVAVVDPGVGAERRPLVVETGRAVYVGPDNGILIPAARREGIVHVYELTNRSLMREEVSATFHGRDIFAPAAAHLASGTLPLECGAEIADFVQPSYAEPRFDGKSATCEVYHIDSFGNIVTNLPDKNLAGLGLSVGEKVILMLGKKRLSARFVRTYSDLGGKEFGVLVGSHGFIEIACREASAARRLRVRIGNVVRVGGV